MVRDTVETMTPQRYCSLGSRYCCVTPLAIEACIDAVRLGNEESALPGFGAREAALVARDVLEAERLLDLEPAELTAGLPALHGDWAHACLVEVLEYAAMKFRQAQEYDGAVRSESLAHDTRLQIVASPWCSPLLWYGDIFFDVAQEQARRKERACLEMQRRHLAHELRFDEGLNARAGLQDLAWFHVALGEAEHGLRIYAELVRDDPSDVWSYNSIAMCLCENGLPELALKAAERGLALTRLKDEHGLKAQLRDLTQELKDLRDELYPSTAALLQEALALDVNSGPRRPPHELCRLIVPDIDTVATKGPEPMPDAEQLASLRRELRTLARPTSQRSRERASVPSGSSVLRTDLSPERRTAPKVGRNDPCPCGSAKKWKRCCGA